MTGDRQMSLDDATVLERLEVVRGAVAETGRDDVRIIAVTKGFDRSAIDSARRVGIADVGENYAQELLEKVDAIDDETNVHFMGRIQRNKVRKIAEHVDLWHSVSRPEILVEVAKRSVDPQVLVQVRPGDDDTKDGVLPSGLDEMFAVAQNHDVEIVGLMTIGVLGDPDATKQAFIDLDRLATAYEVPERSMGMSGDYRDALDAGATMLRLGSILFGPRPER